jgi:hypothetical protein
MNDEIKRIWRQEVAEPNRVTESPRLMQFLKREKAIQITTLLESAAISLRK